MVFEGFYKKADELIITLWDMWCAHARVCPLAAH